MIKEQIFKPGIRIVVDERFESGVESLGIWLRFGYRNELSGQESWSHLIEHVLANGSSKYPTEIEISRVISDTGSYFNAFTSQEAISLQAEFLPIYLDKIFDLMADKILNPLVTDDIVQREKKIINEEYWKNWNNLDNVLFRYSAKSILNGSSLARFPIGKDYAIGDVDSKSLIDFYNKLINSVEIIVVACGPLKMKKISQMVSKYFYSTDFSDHQIIKKEKIYPKKFETGLSSDKSQLVRINFLTTSYSDIRSTVFDIAGFYLSYGKDSKLYSELRLKSGLVYSVSADNYSYSDAGFFSIYFSSTKSEEVKNIINKILKEMPTDMTPEKLEIIKKRLINNRSRNFLRSVENEQKSLGYSLIKRGVLETEEEYGKKIRSIDLETFRNTVLEFLSPDKALVIEIK